MTACNASICVVIVCEAGGAMYNTSLVNKVRRNPVMNFGCLFEPKIFYDHKQLLVLWGAHGVSEIKFTIQ